MSLTPIFTELKSRYGLKSQEVDILSCLQHGDLSADEISRKTRIPLGRLYTFLNSLVMLGLVEKSGRKPYTYSMQPPDEHILDFLKRQFAGAARNQSDILSLLEQKQRVHHIEHIHSSEEFYFYLLQLLQEARQFRAISRHTSFPMSLYAHDKKEFLLIRDAIGRYRQTLVHYSPEVSAIFFNTLTEYHRRLRPYHEIVSKEALDTHLSFIRKRFGDEMIERIRDGIRHKIKHLNFRASVLSEFNPMQIFITDKRVLFSLIHQGKTTGVVIRSSDVVTLYEYLFTTMLSRTVPIEEYLGL